jgi:hypothetical protein
MPKLPVEDVDRSAAARKRFECELATAQIRTALGANNIEGAMQTYAAAVERNGDDFLEICQPFRDRLPAETRAMFDEVVKLAARRDKPAN